MPELLPGDVCVYEFLWRTPAACPVNVKPEQPQEDDSCTVVIPGRDNRYSDVCVLVCRMLAACSVNVKLTSALW
jgi:hypothetical protein